MRTRTGPPPLGGPVAVVLACRPMAIRRGLLGLSLLVALALAGCDHGKIERERSLFEYPLAQLADSGQVEAMRVVADIEVLRGGGIFPDSLANALSAVPASEYIQLDDQGKLTRTGKGTDLAALVEYVAAEPKLLKEKVVTDLQVAELRRMALDNIAAAAEMAVAFRAELPDSLAN